MRKLTVAITGAALLAGCAMNSGAVSIAPNTYVLSRQAATGFTGMGTLRAQAMGEAAATCTKDGKTLRVTDEKQSKPPYLAGNFPRIDLTFACD